MRRVLLTLIMIFSFHLSNGCGWDWDTMQMEKQKFPSIHELITGKFLRHSQEFYYWRVKDREEKLILYPDSMELYDDYAWALDKVGEHQKAIQTMLKKEELFPGIYETYANLGTSYLHSGELEKGIEFIAKAIEINPEAHFGREVYQKYLAEYVLSKKSEGNFSLPLSEGSDPDFYSYLKEHHFENAIAQGSNRDDEIAKAVKGIAGMMKFGNYDSPVLLECLGDLLYAANVGHDPGAGHLGARAYLKASFAIKDEDISLKYRKKAEQSLERMYIDERFRDRMPAHVPEYEGPLYTIRSLERALMIEIVSAEKWFEEIKNNELNWIESGVNPDSAFAANYYEDPIQDHQNERGGPALPEEDESYWLAWQLKQPDHITAIHQYAQLSDEIKAELDSLYEKEFSFIEPEDTMQAAAPEVNGEECDDEGCCCNCTLWIIGGIAGLLVLVLVLLRFRSARKKR